LHADQPARVRARRQPVALPRPIDNQAALACGPVRHEESRITNFLLEPSAILRSSRDVSSEILHMRHLVVARFFRSYSSWGIDKTSAASLVTSPQRVAVAT
jgi:hypothetical protein